MRKHLVSRERGYGKSITARAVLPVSLALLMLLNGCGQTAISLPPTDTPSIAPQTTPTPPASPTATPAATPSPAPPEGGWIAFKSDRDGNLEIYLMGAHGSGQSNLTNNPAEDDWPSLTLDAPTQA